MIEYFRRLRRKRQLARVSAAAEAEFIALATDSAVDPPGYLSRPVPPPTSVLADMKALMDAYASLPQTGWNVAEKGPIKLTRWQLACLQQTRPAPLHHYGGTVSNLLAVPFVEVDTEGWIKP